MRDVDHARQQLQRLEAEIDGARIRASAEQQVWESGKMSLEREKASAEEHRRAMAEMLRQLESREDAITQVGGLWLAVKQLQIAVGGN